MEVVVVVNVVAVAVVAREYVRVWIGEKLTVVCTDRCVDWSGATIPTSSTSTPPS